MEYTGTFSCSLGINTAANHPISSGSITSVTFAPPHVGQYVLTNSRDHCLKLIDVRTHDVVQTYRCEQYRNGANWNKATFSPDGNFIAAGGNDGSIFIWERQSGKLQSTLRNGHKFVFNPLLRQLHSCLNKFALF